MTSRREILKGAGLLSAVGYFGLSVDRSADAVIYDVDDTYLRHEPLRPAAGGVALTAEMNDGYGTLAGGVTGPDGQPAAVTCRHVVDGNYPDGDDDAVIGTTVYQPEDWAQPIGTVIDVGPSKGIDATDWALVEIDTQSKWTSHVLGLGAPAARGEPAIGDRIVSSGMTTGLVGGEITDVGVSTNWRGTLLEDVIEYRVDEDIGTAGNSGAWIGTLDDTGAFQPLGIHAFRAGDYRYAIPVNQAVDGPGATLSSDGSKPTTPDTKPYIEGAIETATTDAVTAVVANIGGTAVSGRSVEIRDTDGSTIDSTTVSLEPLERAVLALTPPADSEPVLDTGDVETRAGY